MFNIRADSPDDLRALLEDLQVQKNPVIRTFMEAYEPERVVKDAFEGTEEVSETAPDEPEPPKDDGLGPCPECGKGQLVKKSRKDGKGTFTGCNQFPACDYIVGRAKK